MKLALMAFLAAFTTSSFAQQFYRELLVQPKNEQKYIDYFGQSCFDSLKSFYKQGKLLKSPYMTARTRPISALAQEDSYFEQTRTKITKSPAGHYTFYHYTKAPNLLTDFEPDQTNRDAVHERNKLRAYPGMMSYLKVPTSKYDSVFSVENYNIAKGFVYVSSCPTCSTMYGHIQLSFTFAPTAKTLDVSTNFSWLSLEQEVSTMYPEVFRACQFNQVGGFIAEDNDIDMIKYYKGMFWYQVTNFYKVVNSDGMVVPAAHDTLTAARASARTYTINKTWGPVGGKTPVATPVKTQVKKPVAAVKPVKEPSIEIVSAAWGTRNVVSNVKAYCETKLTCDYKVHEKYIPGSVYDAASPQPFNVRYKCDGVKIKTAAIPGDAHDKIVSLTCP